MAAPAPDRLQVLLDRACRGVASATEAEQLRAGVAQLQRDHARYRAAWQSARARAHRARCILADYRVEADARTARQAACDHRDPNRIGARLPDLATVCTCGHVLFPPIFPTPPEPLAHRSDISQDPDSGQWDVSCPDCTAQAWNVGDEDDANQWAEQHRADETSSKDPR